MSTPIGEPVASLCCCGSGCGIIGYNAVLLLQGFTTLKLDPAFYPDPTQFPITRLWLSKSLTLTGVWKETIPNAPPHQNFSYTGTITIDQLSGDIDIEEQWTGDGWDWVNESVDVVYGIYDIFDVDGSSVVMTVADDAITVSYGPPGKGRGYYVNMTIKLGNEYTQETIQKNLDDLLNKLGWNQVQEYLAKITTKSTRPVDNCCVTVSWDNVAFYGPNPDYPTIFEPTVGQVFAGAFSFYCTVFPDSSQCRYPNDGSARANKLISPWKRLADVNGGKSAQLLVAWFGGGILNSIGYAPFYSDIQSAAWMLFPNVDLNIGFTLFIGNPLSGVAVGEKMYVLQGGSFCKSHTQDTFTSAGPPLFQSFPGSYPGANYQQCTYHQGTAVTIASGTEIKAANLIFNGYNSWINDFFAYYAGWSVNPSPTTNPNPFAPPCSQLCLPPS